MSKNVLIKGTICTRIKEIIENLKALKTNCFQECFAKRRYKHEICVAVQENYFEKNVG